MGRKGGLAGVIFDMDGVLIDSEPLHYQSTILYLNEELGLGYNEEENEEFLGRSDEYMFRILQKRYGLPFSVGEMIRRRRDIYLGLLSGHVRLISGVRELILSLKTAGYQLGLASSSLIKIIDVVVNEGEIRQYFDVLQSGESLPNCKPHPEIFLVTAEKLGIKPESCAVIEDTAVGIQAARAAGMTAIAYNAPGAPAQDFSEANHTCTSMSETADFLLS